MDTTINSKYIISEDAKRAAKKCKKDFICLNRNPADICKVICCINDEELYVKCGAELDCPYILKHNDRDLCMCPVRSEIYSKYRL